MKLYNHAWYRLFRGILSAYVHFYMRVRSYDKVKLPKGPKIFAINHPTVWDAFPPLIGRRDNFLSVLVEDQIWSFTLWRFFFTYSSQIKLYRDKRSEQSMDDARFVLNHNRSILISPEGGRTPQGTIARGKRGFVRLALECRVPIVPVGAYLPARSIVRKEFHYNNGGKKYIDIAEVPKFRAKYSLIYGEPIYLDKYYDKDLTMDEYQEIATMVLDRIYALADEAKQYSV